MTSPDPSKPASSTKTPAARVTEQLAAIDTSLLDKLIDSRAEQTRLNDYLSRAEDRREKVANAVWNRVVEDYRRRAAALEAEAALLKERVRREYRKLHALIESVQQVNTEAELSRDELRFRHEVGELSKSALEKGLEKPEQVLAQCAADLAAVNAQKARFVEALGSEAELAVEPAAASNDDPTDPIDTGEQPVRPSSTAPVSTAAPAPADMTKTQPPSMTRAVPVADVPESAGAGAEEGDEDRTFLLPAAALLVTFEGQDAATEYRLAALNYIGRSDDNQLQIARPGVSRKHALVAATMDGFSIKDLGSQNGTYVNGDRITEQPLADGDQIVIGDTKLVFRLPWPSPVKAAAPAT